MRENAEIIANLDPRIPLIADADTGYGGGFVQEFRRTWLMSFT